MIKELNLNCPYKVFVNTSLEIYSFTTDNTVEYKISFIDSNYLFEGTIGEGEIQNAFSLSIENINETLTPQDSKVKATISCIIKYFFENKENCIIYVCDSSDKRELARYRKFNQWFYSENKDPKIEKLNEIFVTDKETSHYTTMIYH